MNSLALDQRCTLPMSFGNMTKINPFNQKRNITITNNASNKRKYKIPISNREFGKEINISTNFENLPENITFNIFCVFTHW